MGPHSHLVSRIFLFLLVFQAKHFLADYPLQGKYMLGKFRETGWVVPLSAHAAVHGLMTAGIALWFGSPHFIELAYLDCVVHFAMDAVKCRPTLMGRWKPLTKETYMGSTDAQKRANTLFWWSIGVDQGVHHITHYGILWLMLGGF